MYEYDTLEPPFFILFLFLFLFSFSFSFFLYQPGRSLCFILAKIHPQYKKGVKSQALLVCLFVYLFV